MRHPTPPARLRDQVTGAGAAVRSAVAGALVVGATVVAAVLGPAGAPARAEPARPTVDPTAPTPTIPHVAGPPQGSAADGSTVGGEGLDTRGVVTAEGAPPLPEGIDAHGWLVADAGTGQVLGARDPHGRYYPASTIKTLTLLTLAPQLDPAQVVVATVEDEAIEGSRVGLVRDGQYPVDLLFRALVMQSGNDVANALARAAGGVAPTVAAMNATAARLGASDTVVGTPSGLDVAGQSSSPYDLALFLRELVADPYTLDVLQTRIAQMPPAPGYEGFQIQSQNALLADYPGTLGGKTGFTDAARHTFVAAAERDGRRLVVSLMQAERRPVHEQEQATRLLDWGFATPPTVDAPGRLVDPDEPEPTASATPTRATRTASPARAAAAPPATAAPAPVAEESSPLVPAALAVAAVLVVLATVVGRRRARRPVSRPVAPADDGSAAGSPPRPPGHRRPAAPPPSAPGTPPGSSPGSSPGTPRSGHRDEPGPGVPGPAR
ncbi:MULTISPECIES: D-alanyl-D-alanine carboxypeptidase family protein [unclassified Modestobacter]